MDSNEAQVFGEGKQRHRLAAAQWEGSQKHRMGRLVHGLMGWVFLMSFTMFHPIDS